MSDPRVSVVVLTHNRPRELEHCLRQLTQLPEQPPIIVVDNASRGPGTALILRHFPQVQRIRCDRNLGAAARNLGVGRVRTRYVAFCDDDGWWAPGALARAADLMDGDERIGLVAASVRVGAAEQLDPACLRMAQSDALLGFMAGAAVMRTRAFRSTGGFEPRLFLGGEEVLMSLELATRGWRMVYAPHVGSYRHPSPLRDAEARRRLRVRNRVWVAWLRLPPAAALQETWAAWREARAQNEGWRLAGAALRGLRWVLAERRRISAPVHAMWEAAHTASPTPLMAPGQEAWR
ncbi:MAG TPA: glycosyltransferase [Ideonella sp.]|jgi:GT2 family glycosyltransferase|nr:glycosyltransferase [Ideonella sp.]